jgi:hypothetical protein
MLPTAVDSRENPTIFSSCTLGTIRRLVFAPKRARKSWHPKNTSTIAVLISRRIVFCLTLFVNLIACQLNAAALLRATGSQKTNTHSSGHHLSTGLPRYLRIPLLVRQHVDGKCRRDQRIIFLHHIVGISETAVYGLLRKCYGQGETGSRNDVRIVKA